MYSGWKRARLILKMVLVRGRVISVTVLTTEECVINSIAHDRQIQSQRVLSRSTYNQV